MNGRRLAALFAALSLAAAVSGGAAAQTSPSVDGRIEPGEYPFETSAGPLTLYAAVEAGTIHLAVVGRTSGWVAVGVGSRRMEGATIFMGYVAGGREAFTFQQGRGHSHRSAGRAEPPHAVAEHDGTTTLEVALERSAYLGAGASSLDAIYAMGDTDSFVLYHAARAQATIPVP